MTDAILFILIIINLSLTFVLFIKYSSHKGDENAEEVRKEMSDVLVRFNNDAERNIKILEDRIRTVKELEHREILSSARADRDERGDQKPNRLLNKVLESTRVQNAQESLNEGLEANRPSRESSAVIKETQASNLAKKSYIQKAYNTPSQTPQKSSSNHSKEIIKDHQNSSQTHEYTEKKDKTHQIARLIGEGKTFEEISGLLGMSLGEIQLFTALLRKKLVG